MVVPCSLNESEKMSGSMISGLCALFKSHINEMSHEGGAQRNDLHGSELRTLRRIPELDHRD